MPYTAPYVDGGKGVFKKGTGLVTGLEIFTSNLHETANPARPRGIRFALIDFSETTDLRITPLEIRRIIEINRKLAATTPGEVVSIVAPTELPYAMARLWHTLSDDFGWQSNVFHTWADAIYWLRKELQKANDTGSVLDEFPSLRLET